MKLGIISDIHEDAVRLSEALHLLDKAACHEIACLGDICGFVIPSFAYQLERDASTCLQLVRKNCKYIVAGNHDLSAAQRIPDHTAGFHYPENWYGMDYKDRKMRAGEEIWINEETELPSLVSAEDKEFLKSVPEYEVVHDQYVKILLSHYLYPDLCGTSIRHYKEFGPVQAHLDFMKSLGCQVGLSGHKHVEGFYRVTSKSVSHHDFGNHGLSRERQWIVGPCVANGKHKNGCLVFDTESLQLEVIPLNSKPRVLMTVDYKKNKNAE